MLSASVLNALRSSAQTVKNLRIWQKSEGSDRLDALSFITHR